MCFLSSDFLSGVISSFHNHILAFKSTTPTFQVNKALLIFIGVKLYFKTKTLLCQLLELEEEEGKGANLWAQLVEWNRCVVIG